MLPQSGVCSCSCHDTSQLHDELTTSTMSDAHAIIDDRIAGLEAQIRSLRSIRNRKAHILSLPTEILGLILTQAVEPDLVFDARSWKEHVQLSAVCMLWRDVALHCPSFWSCIPIQHSNKLAEMLARSKHHPLSIRLNLKRTLRSPLAERNIPLQEKMLS
jgi:hypothetical protein